MLPGSALAVRGGGENFDAMLRSAALDCWEEFNRPGVSIYADELTLPELLRQAPGARNKHIRVTTVGLLRVHFEVEWTGERPHATIWLPNAGAHTFRVLASCFSGPILRADVDKIYGVGRTPFEPPTSST